MTTITSHRTSAAASPGSLNDVSPSAAKVFQIERKYTGVANEHKTRISAEDVRAVIAAVSTKALDVGGREALAGFAFTFGGTELHPKSAFTPEDKVAVRRAIMKGIETGDQVAALPTGLQAQVLNKMAFGITQSNVTGIKTDSKTGPQFLSAIDASSRSAIAKAVGSLSVPKGFEGPTQQTVTRALRQGKPYGYQVTVAYQSPSGREFSADWLANAKGTILASDRGVAAPDHTPED
jgi:hypothetical protein